MKIQIASDLHLEFWDGTNANQVKKVDRDLLILAGDISVGTGAKAFIKEHLKISPVVYVPGNHEYYDWMMRDELDAWWRNQAAKKLPDLHYLQMDEVVLDGVRIKGATWYSDFWGEGSEYAQQGIADFKYPYNQPGIWDTDKHLDAHVQATEWLKQGERADVIVTHFPPTKEAIAKIYMSPNPASIFNSYFINDKEDLVRELNPKLWISGHTHTPFDYMVGNCRCVGNPRGYPNESNLFSVAKIIEI